MEGPKYPEPTAPSTSIASASNKKPSNTSATKPKATKKRDIAKVEKKKTSAPIEDSNEKILYVLDANATNLPPEILYEEAYFRMQLNDGTHKKAAAKYLATQEDWYTEKNLKFIFDFLYDTDSEEFKFFVANKDSFEKYIGQEKINQSLKILIENKLYQGIPRPTFDQSNYLLSLIDSENAEKNNYHYFLNRLFTETNETEFLSMAEEYFKKFEQTNQEITLNYIETKLKGLTQKNKIKSLAGLISNIESPTEDYHFLICHAKIYLALSDKANASNYVNKAIILAKENKIDTTEAIGLLDTIESL